MKGIICDRCKEPKSRGQAHWMKLRGTYALFGGTHRRHFDLCNRCAQAVALYAMGEKEVSR